MKNQIVPVPSTSRTLDTSIESEEPPIKKQKMSDTSRTVQSEKPDSPVPSTSRTANTSIQIEKPDSPVPSTSRTLDTSIEIEKPDSPVPSTSQTANTSESATSLWKKRNAFSKHSQEKKKQQNISSQGASKSFLPL